MAQTLVAQAAQAAAVLILGWQAEQAQQIKVALAGLGLPAQEVAAEAAQARWVVMLEAVLAETVETGFLQALQVPLSHALAVVGGTAAAAADLAALAAVAL